MKPEARTLARTLARASLRAAITQLSFGKPANDAEARRLINLAARKIAPPEPIPFKPRTSADPL